MNLENHPDEEEEQETSLNDLPLELYAEIGSHSPLKSFMNFKAASKSYYDLKELYTGRKYDGIQEQFDWLFERGIYYLDAKSHWNDALLANIVKKRAKVTVDLMTPYSYYFKLLNAVIERDGVGEINLGA